MRVRIHRALLGGRRGQASAEYLGAILLVSVILAAIVLAAPRLGIDTRLRELICTIAGGSCQEQQAAATEPCTISTSGRDASLNAQIIAVDLSTGGSYLREDKSNGKTTFTVSDSGSIAGALRAGAEAKIGSIGFKASAEATAGGRLEGAMEYEVDTKDAEAIEDALSRQGGVGQLLRDGAETGLAGPGVDWVNDQIFGEDEPDLPEPTSRYITAQAAVSAGGEASADGGPVGDAKLKAALAGAGGARRIVSGKRAGETEVYVKLDAETAGSLSAGTLGGGVATNGSGVAILTLDGRDLTSLRLSTSNEITGSLNLGRELEGSDLGDLAGRLEKASIKSSSGSGRRLELGASLELSGDENAANRDAVVRTLTDGVVAVPDLLRQIDENGTVTLQTSDVSSSEAEVSANVGVGVNAGAGGTQSSNESKTTGALIRGPSAPGFTVQECG